jgi:hypothetical protein
LTRFLKSSRRITKTNQPGRPGEKIQVLFKIIKYREGKYMSKMDKSWAAGSVAMKAVIVCEDFAFAARANATLRRANILTGSKVLWTLKCWPENAFSEVEFADRALVESLDAHLIVFPTRRAESLPPGLLDWLERWAAERQIHDAALGVIGDDQVGSFTRSVCPQLSDFINKHSLNFIMDNGSVSRNARKPVVPIPREPRLPLLAEQSACAELAARGSYRAWGINE